MSFQVLPGFRDYLPEDLATRRWIESAWRRASVGAGFQEIDGPVLEPLELLTAKSGEEITEQLYAFEDRGGRKVAMRAEMTPTLARMVAGCAASLPKPIKWYCIPEFYRYEKPQRGRRRAFTQWNVDLVGSESSGADAETMAVAIEALRLLGLSSADVVLRVNDRRLVRRLLRSIDVGAEDEALVQGLIDKLERDRKASRRLEEVLGPKRAREIAGWCERLPLDDADELAALLGACEDLGIAEFVQPDFGIMRGFDYYTGPVWEVFDRSKTLRSVAGGGRYDGLIELLGGPSMPATGFGMGDVVLAELLAQKGLVPKPQPRLDVAVIPIGEEMEGAARRVVAKLRAAGSRVEAPYGSPRVGRALRAAEIAGARRAILVGPDEWRDGCVRVKDLETGDESQVPLDELT